MAAPAAASTSSSSPSAGAQWRAAVSKLPEAVLKASLALVRESSDASSSKSDVDELCTLQAKRAHGRLLEKAHECGQKDVVTAIEKADIGALGSLLAKLPADVLATIAKSLDAPSCSASKLPIAVEDELLLLGARDLLAELDSQQIKEWLPGLKHKTSYKKWQIVDQILMDVFQLNAPSAEDLPASKKSKKEKEDPKETDASGQPLDYTPRGAPRPSIENIVKGVTATKLFDLYNATDLREYCKKHGLKTTGKKNQLIKSIISFLDGDDQNGAKDTDKGGKAASDVEDDE